MISLVLAFLTGLDLPEERTPAPRVSEFPRSLEEPAAEPADTSEPEDAVRDLEAKLVTFEARTSPSFAYTGPTCPGAAAPEVSANVPAGAAPGPRPTLQDFQPPHDSFGDFFETHFSGQAWRDYVWEDYLATPKVLLPIGLAAAAAAVSHWDRRIQQRIFGLLGDRGWYSDTGQYALIAAVIVDGLIFPGEGRNWWDEAWTIGESYGASSLTAYMLKTEVKRPRPGSVPGTGKGTHSFPSGHTTGAFTAATLMEANSGPWVGVPSYLLASFVGFERVEEGRHYLSDVLAGAAIGSLSAGIFDALHWGGGTEGGIARPSGKVSFDMDSLKGFQLSMTIKF